VISPKAVQNPGGLTRWLTRVHFGSLCMPFRYFLSFRSKMVYLSFGSISSSRGISLYQRSIAFAVTPPFFSSAALTVSTTLSTSLSRFRCRAFCGAESRHGIFLYTIISMQRPAQIRWERYHSSPPDRGAEGLNIVLMELGGLVPWNRASFWNWKASKCCLPGAVQEL